MWSRYKELSFGFLLMCAYWPGIFGMARTPRWIVGGLIVAAFAFAPRVQWTRTHIVGLLLVLWLLLSVVLHPTWDAGDAVLRLIIIVIAFAWGSTLTDVRPFILGAAMGLAVSSVIVVLQSLDLVTMPTADGHAAALFFNKNYLAEAAALVIVALGAYQLGWWIAPLLPAVLLPMSKTAFLALIPLAFAAATMLGQSSVERLAIWQDVLGALTLTGHGLGSFWTTFPDHAQHYLATRQDPNMPEHPHNEYLLVAYEGGYIGLALMLGFAVCLWRDAQEKMVIASLAIVACFSVLSNNPASILFGAVCAGFAVTARVPEPRVFGAGGD